MSFTSLLCAQDTGGENPYIDTKDVLKLLDYGRLGRQAAGHPWSALRVVKSCRKDCPTASVLPKLPVALPNDYILDGARLLLSHCGMESESIAKEATWSRSGFKVTPWAASTLLLVVSELGIDSVIDRSQTDSDENNDN